MESLFSFTRHGYLWRIRYRDPVGTKWVFSWTRRRALRLAHGHGIVSAERVTRPKGRSWRG